MPTARKTRRLAYFYLLVNAALWGLAVPFVKTGYQYGLTPIQFLLGRYFFASIFSLPIFYYHLKRTPKSQRSKLPLLKIIPLELLGTLVAFLLLYQGINLTSAVEASLLSITWPIFTTIGGVIFLKEKEERHEAIGLLIAVLGTIMLSVVPLFNKGPNGSLKGNLLIFLFTLVTSVYLLLIKRAYKNLNKWLIVSIGFYVNLLVFFIVALVQDQSPLNLVVSLFQNPSPWPLIATLYMATLGSIVALTFYLHGQDKIEASEAAMFTYLEPIFSIPAVIILLNQYPKPLEIFSFILIVIGVYLAEKR